MTIASTTTAASYNGNSVTTIFTVPFYFLLATDLVLTATSAGPVVVALGLNVDYTVSGAGGLTGGTVTLTTAPASGTVLAITRAVPVTQLTDYITDDPFPAESHEKALDKLTMICQQIQTNIDNAVLASSTEGEVNTASNLGSGLNVFKQKAVLDLQFRSLSSPANGTVGMAIVSDRIEIDVKHLLGIANEWDGGMQNLLYNIPTVATSSDHVGWSGLVHNNTGSTNKDNMIGLRGHVYHDGTFDNDTGGAWGLTTEVWTNQQGATTMVAGELSVISQAPYNAFPIVGLNSVFKNHADNVTHPVAAVGAGARYNVKSSAIFISGQHRPRGTGAAWSDVGSGWNSAIRIGDIGYGSGLDWEGGNTYPGGVLKEYSTVLDMTTMNDIVHGACRDMGGGFPWLFLWRNGLTYFGARFNAQITTGEIEIWGAVPFAGGAGYAAGDVGTIAGGTGGTYEVTTVSAGAVTAVDVTNAGTGYYVHPGASTTATTGGGTGLKIALKQVVGERIEFWRMVNPGDPGSGGGKRYGFIDFAYTPLDQDGGFVKNGQ